MITAIIIIAIAIVFLIFMATVFPEFYGWVGRNTPRVLINFVAPAMFWHAVVMLGWFIVSFLLFSLGIMFNSGFLIGVSALLSIINMYLFFLVPGLVRKVFGMTFFTLILRTLVSYQAALGLIGLLFPEAITLTLLLAVSLFAFLSVGLSSKFNFLGIIVVPVITIMCLMAIWKYVDYKSYYVLTDSIAAHKEDVLEDIHRNTIETKSDTRSTYGRLLKNVRVAYTATLENDKITALNDYAVNLSKDSVFLLIPHKEDVYSYGGQTFVEIKISSQNGSFASGTNLWIDADLIQLGIRKDLDAEVLANKKNKREQERPAVVQNKSTSTPAASSINSANMVLGPGVHEIYLKAGQETGWLATPDCGKYHINTKSKTYNHRLIFSDHDEYDDGPTVRIPEKSNARLKIRANVDELVTVTVTRKV